MVFVCILDPAKMLRVSFSFPFKLSQNQAVLAPQNRNNTLEGKTPKLIWRLLFCLVSFLSFYFHQFLRAETADLRDRKWPHGTRSGDKELHNRRLFHLSGATSGTCKVIPFESCFKNRNLKNCFKRGISLHYFKTNFGLIDLSATCKVFHSKGRILQYA